MLPERQTFWDHLDELRGSLIKMIAAVLVCGIIAFCVKDALFGIILAPTQESFITYRLLRTISEALHGAMPDTLGVRLINTGLAHQFLLHVKTAACAGTLVAAPYLLFILFRFIAPALYQNERRCAARIAISGSLMFAAGILFSYFLIFPLTFRFLGNYQVSDVVENTVTITSYIDTLMSLCLSMGIIFEIPVVCWLLARFGLLRADIMRKFNRHIIVAVLIAAAIITPTSDVFTLTLVALPMWLLYEGSILIVKWTEMARAK